MTGEGKDGRGSQGGPSSPLPEAGGRGLEENYKGNLSRPRPQGIISFNKRAQIFTVAGLAFVFMLIMYGVMQEPGGGGGKGADAIISPKKQATEKNAADAIKKMIPEGPILPKRVESVQTENADAQTPDWFSGDIKQESQPNQKQIPAVAPPIMGGATPPLPSTPSVAQAPIVPAPKSPPPAAPPAPEDPEIAKRRVADAAAAQASTMLAGGFKPHEKLPDEQTKAAKEKEIDAQYESQRDAFFQQAQGGIGANYVRSVPTAPLSPYEIKAGWLIPGVLEHGINTSMPGMTTARVSQNVYDSTTGEHVLIPQGSRLIGKYQNTIGFAQDRVTVAWDRIIFPDGSSMNLESQQAVDAEGFSGLSDKVNNHWGSVIAAALLTSVFSAIPIYVQNAQAVSNTLSAVDGSGAAVAVQNPKLAAAQSVATQLAATGQGVTQRFLNIPPTVEIRAGYRFYIRVQKDLAFIRPYEYGATEQATGLSISGVSNVASGATGLVTPTKNAVQSQSSSSTGTTNLLAR